MNELQIILMHLDLENPSEARKAVLKTTNAMKQDALLSALGLPKVQQWILTFDWIYTAFRSTLTCDLKKGHRQVNDEDLVEYLGALFNNIEETLDPFSDYEVHFDVFADETNWSLTVTIEGGLPETNKIVSKPDNIVVEEIITHNLWTFKLLGQ